jgi:hypothetical protein
MNYSKSVLLHEDKPEYGRFLKLIFTLVPAAMLVGSMILFSQGEREGSVALLIEAFILGLVFWIVLPRKYQVYEDHVRIVLGGSLSVKVGFDKIQAIEATSRLTLSVNFVTKFTKSYVEINKKKGFSIAITPRDRDLFVENANRALVQWTESILNSP